MRLAGRRILVSGAASGIGRATAELFLREGAAVALLDIDEGALASAAQALRASGTTHGTVCPELVADVADRAAVDTAIAHAAQALGGLDGLVCSAGIDLLSPFGETTAAQWQRVLDVNLTGPFNLCQAALPWLRATREATIVHIASGAALRPLASRTAYCASKAGLVMFAKTLAVDLAADGVRVNVVCPGIIDTPLFRRSLEGAVDPQAELERVLDRYVIRRVGRPEDIAYAALYLTSAESAMVTGSALAVDGGRTFH